MDLEIIFVLDSMELNIPDSNIPNKVMDKNNKIKVMEQTKTKEKTTRVGQIIKLLEGIELYYQKITEYPSKYYFSPINRYK